MCNTCATQKRATISQKSLWINTKARSNLDVSGAISLTAFLEMEGAMAAWIETLVLETVIEAVSQNYMTATAFYQQMGEILRRKEREIPDMIRRYIQRQVQHGRELALDKIGDVIADVPSTLETSREMASAVSRFTRAFNDSARNALEAIVRQHITDGLSLEQTTRGIQQWATESGDLKRATKWRAATIARTETARTIVNGELSGWKDSGVVSHVRWLISPQPCEFCLAVYRKFRQVELGQNFLNVGQTLGGTRGGTFRVDYENIQGPPLHPNCLCDLEPVVVGSETLRRDPRISRDRRIG